MNRRMHFVVLAASRSIAGEAVRAHRRRCTGEARRSDAKLYDETVNKAIEFLRTSQAADGSFSAEGRAGRHRPGRHGRAARTAARPTTRWWPRA